MRALVRAALRRHGYQVLEACDGQSALQLADAVSGDIELLLTDLVMPGLSGIDLAEQLTSDSRTSGSCT